MKKHAIKKPQIVLVSTDPENQTSSIEELERAGYEVTVVKDGNKAINVEDFKAKHWKPSIFIIDVVLVKMSGYELSRRVLSKYADGKVSVILYAQHIEAVDKLEAQHVGALALIPKPVSWTAVSEVLEKEKARRTKMEMRGQFI